MALSKEFRKRIEIWIDELPKYFYEKISFVEFEGFTTFEQLSLKDALAKNWKPMNTGTNWGEKWEYGWFKTTIIVPKGYAGKSIALKVGVGVEMLIFVNGEESGSIDHRHFELFLTHNAVEGEKFEIVCECYAGHGEHLENCRPIPPGVNAVPEITGTQVIISESSFGVWNKEAYALYMDACTLFTAREKMNQNSLRVANIDKALRNFSLAADFELEKPERDESFSLAREELKAELQCVNGSTAPEMYIFGQSHLDLAWHWPLEETKRKSARTMSNFMGYIRDYPDMKFLMTQAPVFMYLKEYYPNLYKRVCDKIKTGQIVAEGATWVEPDTNLPSGESLIRQFLYGKEFFENELKINSELLWLPDCFGFSAALPQIIRGCGVKYFASQKILRSYNDCEIFPYNTFYWEGIDGTRVLTHMFLRQNSEIDPGTIIQRWENDINQRDDIEKLMMPFGYGDGGGGPTKKHMEYATRVRDLEGVPRTKIKGPTEFLHEIENDDIKNIYVGELYFSAHRGTYTSQAKTKKGNRQSEFALRDLEFWSSFSSLFKNAVYDYEKTEYLWKKVLLNQFHDIIPGSSIKRVYDEAEADYNEVIECSEKIVAEKSKHFTEINDTDFSVLNSLNWDRNEIVCLGKSQEKGGFLGQIFENNFYTQIKATSCGITPLSQSFIEDAKDSDLSISNNCMENKFLIVKLNSFGEITSIWDKESNMELLSGNANKFKMYKDVTNHYDAWDIDSMFENLPVDIDTNANVTIETVAKGPLFGCLRIKRKINNSVLEQDIYIYHDSRKIDFKTRIDWSENHKLLKVSFPTTIHSDEVLNEIQFGYIKRPTHRSKRSDADKYEVCNHKWSALKDNSHGVAILNDSKYGIGVLENTMTLTLLKSALIPDMYADKGVQEFVYSFYCWNNSFDKSQVVQRAYELNNPLKIVQGKSEKHSFLHLDNNSIIIESVKLSQDKKGELIVRMYEAYETSCKCVLETDFEIKNAYTTNMVEDIISDAKFESNKIYLEFKPFEVKTVKIKLK